MKFILTMSNWACPKKIDPSKYLSDDRGLTGSESSLLSIAKRLGELGHQVLVLSNFTNKHLSGNICYCDIGEWQGQEYFDVAIAWIDPAAIQHINAGLKIFNQQVNDFGYCPGWESYIDIITTPSLVHKNYLKQFSSFDTNKWKILYNGAEEPVNYESIRTHNRLIYASSPDRGLHWLLEMYPDLKKEIPDLTLHIYYDFDNFYEAFRGVRNEMGNRLRYIKYAIDKLKGYGIFHHKNISKEKILKEYASSSVLAYPCDPVSFTEGFSVTTLEAAIHGCIPVICGSDALESIYGDYVPFVKSPFVDNKKKYYELLLDILRDEGLQEKYRSKCIELKSIYNYTAITNNLIDMVREFKK